MKPLKDMLDSVRDIEGFPIGKDEDILELSDPPYYTACPNPYINDFIEKHGKSYVEKTDDYHREPFVSDVSEGKNDPIYNAHSYHTKVPHKAIMKYIEHYTEEGDIVYDGFCGTGMTGVAAQLLNRKAILSDLSPIATFIAYNYNKHVDKVVFEKEAKSILREVEDDCGWMYETIHTEKNEKIITQYNFEGNKQTEGKGKINYTIWSDVFICTYCGEEIVFWANAVDEETGSVKKEFNCPSCKASMQKTECERATTTFIDSAIGKDITQGKQVPVLINYSYGTKRYNKTPDAFDLALIKKIENSNIPYWFPTDPMMKVGEKWGDTWRRGVHFGITHVHHFFYKRTLWIMGSMHNKICQSGNIKLFWLLTSITEGSSKLNRERPNGLPSKLSGTLYVSSMIREINTISFFSRKIKKYISSKIDTTNSINIGTNSATSIALKDNSVDYIFTDPPFGDNLMYSELSFLWESWLKIVTNTTTETVINKSQNKGLLEYSELMLRSFNEYYRILKPNRWVTVEFHNSKSSVWTVIQDSMTKSGFIIAHVAVLDKKQGSFTQVTSSGSVKNDLVISAYKPKQHFEQKFLEFAGAGLEKEFIEMHLSHLPAEPSIERTEQMLYSKMLAFYVQRSYMVKYDASTFYKMLRNNFAEEDVYWFNRDQIDNYHEYKKKMKLEGIDDIRKGIMSMFVSDEKSALIWLHTFLNESKDFKTIHPEFTKVANISGDQTPDLRVLLDNNFILENDKYRRPNTELETLNVTHKREKELLREFEVLLLEAKGSKRRIKECRKQAVIFGFEHCYKKERFQDILILARSLNSKIIESDSELNEFIEVAELKVEGF
ncbi:MAG: DNA methylase [Candidatus Cloacimonetes bacterium]|nr:DNA methylase [Candidatus Cloacimonadota bacterium]